MTSRTDASSGWTRLAPAGLLALSTCFLLWAPVSRASALPPGIAPQEWIDRNPRTPEEALQFIREVRARHRARRASAKPPPNAIRSAPIEALWREWGPPSRDDHTLLYDSRRDQLMVLGGSHYHPARNVWTMLAGSTDRWSPLAIAGELPAATLNLAAVYDSTHDRVIALALVADPDFPQAHTELWTLELSGFPAWTPLATSGVAPAYTSDDVPTLALDEAGERLFAMHVLGEPPGGSVWTLDLDGALTWSPLFESPEGSFYRVSSAFFDARRQRLVIATQEGLWALNPDAPSEWANIGTAYFPSGDANRVLFDPANDDFIEISDRGDAVRIPGAGGPATEIGCYGCLRSAGLAAAWDGARNRAVMHGGWNAPVGKTSSETRALSPGQPGEWQEIGPGSGGARLWHEAIVDAARDRVLVYGGLFMTDRPDTLISRSLADPNGPVTTLVPAPGARPRFYFGPSAIADPARDRVLFYGGEAADNSTFILDELWSLSLSDPPAWTKLSPSGTGPGPLAFSAATLDEAHDRVVFFGGIAPSPSTHAVWELSLSPTIAWRPLEVAGDGDGRTVVQVFRKGQGGESWAWVRQQPIEIQRVHLNPDTIRFETIPQTGGPTDAYSIEPLAFDAIRNRLIVTEERFDEAEKFGAYWSVQLGTQAVWTRYEAPGSKPYDRYLYAAVPDVARDRVLLYGGYDDTQRYFDDWWSLDFALPTPVLASVVSSRVIGGVATIEWRIRGAVPAELTIERRHDPDAWRALARVVASDGQVRFVDDDVRPGARYGYRLVARGETGDEAFGETWLDVPESSAFALLGPSRNPVSGDVEVAYSLERGSHARLELLDVQGRRLAARVVRSGESGVGRTKLAARGEHAPGVYLIRLSDELRSRSARVVIVR